MSADLRRDAVLGHECLHLVDVQRARCEMVDMWSLERHNVGDQPMSIMKAVVHRESDIGLIVPAKGLKDFSDELLSIVLGQAALSLSLLRQLKGARREDLAFGEDGCCLLPQGFVCNQIEAQERCKDTKGIVLEGDLTHRPESRRVNRHTRCREIVVADGIHAHDGEDASHHGKFRSCSETDGTVALFGNTLQVVGRFEPGL